MQKYLTNKLFILAVLFPSVSFAQANADNLTLWGLARNWYFNFILPFSSVMAGIVIVIAGIMYATSGGDATKTGKAKELIIGALTGLVVLIFAAGILRTIIS